MVTEGPQPRQVVVETLRKAEPQQGEAEQEQRKAEPKQRKAEQEPRKAEPKQRESDPGKAKSERESREQEIVSRWVPTGQRTESASQEKQKQGKTPVQKQGTEWWQEVERQVPQDA